LFHVDVSGLQKVVVLDVGQGGLGCVAFDLFLASIDHIFVLSLNSIVGVGDIFESQLIIFSLIQPGLHFISEFFSGFSEYIPESFYLKCVVAIAILKLVPETFKIGFV
jgi:hypothetical protein